jgi:hypothetical protein
LIQVDGSVAIGGTTATGGTASTGGTTSAGGTTAAGGTSSTGGFNINASITCDPVGTNMSYAFVQSWAGLPVDNSLSTSRFCFNPAFLLFTSDGEVRSCPASATLRIYDEAALNSASASLDMNLTDMPLTVDGYCVSGFADGNYHVSYSYPGVLKAWAYYPTLASSPDLPAPSKQWIEKDPDGSYGITFRVDGNTFSPGPFSANY